MRMKQRRPWWLSRCPHRNSCKFWRPILYCTSPRRSQCSWSSPWLLGRCRRDTPCMNLPPLQSNGPLRSSSNWMKQMLRWCPSICPQHKWSKWCLMSLRLRSNTCPRDSSNTGTIQRSLGKCPRCNWCSLSSQLNLLKFCRAIMFLARVVS